MVAAIIGAAGVAANLYGSMQQSDSADQAQQNAQQASQQQAAIAQQGIDFQKQNYNNWHDTFMPMLGSIKDAALASQQPNYQGVAGDVGHAFDASYQTNLRQMQRYGMRPTDGAATAMNTEYGLGRAAALVGGFQNERHRVLDQRLQNMESVYHLGDPMLTGSMNGMSSAIGNASNVYGQQANQQYGLASTYGQASGAMLGSAINGGMGVYNTYRGNNGGLTVNYDPGTVQPPPSSWNVNLGG